jgi:hypothetical protein
MCKILTELSFRELPNWLSGLRGIQTLTNYLRLDSTVQAVAVGGESNLISSNLTMI